MAEQKVALAAELERARAALARNFEAVRQDLDVGTHLKESFHTHKTAYIGGATFLGLLLAKLPTRKKKVYVERNPKGAVKEAEKAGIWLVLLQFLFNILRPTLTKLVTQGVTAYVRSRGKSTE